MFKWNTLFFILLGLLFIEVLVVFPTQVDKSNSEFDLKNKSPEASFDKGQADQSIKGFHLVESRNGSRDWELFATQVDGYGGRGDWKLSNAKVLFYNEEKVDFTVTGAHGVVDGNTKDMRIFGGVLTTSSNGYQFKTADLNYVARMRKMTSSGQVNMVGPDEGKVKGLRVVGQKMLVLVDEGVMQISESVKAEKAINEEENFFISAGLAEFSTKSKVGKFQGNVEMDYLTMKLRGPEVSFVYGKGADILRSVNFKGGVKVSDAERYAMSEALNLDLLTKKFVFTGKPRVVSGGDELFGEKIIFLEGGKKIKVENVRAKMEKQDSK